MLFSISIQKKLIGLSRRSCMFVSVTFSCYVWFQIPRGQKRNQARSRPLRRQVIGITARKLFSTTSKETSVSRKPLWLSPRNKDNWPRFMLNRYMCIFGKWNLGGGVSGKKRARGRVNERLERIVLYDVTPNLCNLHKSLYFLQRRRVFVFPLSVRRLRLAVDIVVSFVVSQK